MIGTTPTLMDEIKSIIGPAATAKLARASLMGQAPLFTAALSWSLEQSRKNIKPEA